MKLPYFKKRYYLSGIDWIISAIDYYMRTTSPAGNHSTLVVELQTPCNKAELQERLKQIITAIPLMNAYPKRDLVNLAPYWKLPSKNKSTIPEINTIACHSEDEFESIRNDVLNISLKTKNDHMYFTLANGKYANFIFFTFDHKLFDARGAEMFLNLLVGDNKETINKLLAQVKQTNAPKLKDWRKKFQAGKDIQRHFIALSQNDYVAFSDYSMNNPPENNGPNLNAITSVFSEKETSHIAEQSEKIAGFMMETTFFLAVTTLALHKIISPEKEACYNIPMPVDMRKPGSEIQTLLCNYLSFMFLDINIKQNMTLEDVVCVIRNKIFYNIENELPEKLLKATRLARIAPLPILKHFMKLPMKGKVATFAFANVGNSSTSATNILNHKINNISHLPRIPSPPCLGIFFHRFAGKLQFTLSWDKLAIEKETASSIISNIKELILT